MPPSICGLSKRISQTELSQPPTTLRSISRKIRRFISAPRATSFPSGIDNVRIRLLRVGDDLSVPKELAAKFYPTVEMDFWKPFQPKSE